MPSTRARLPAERALSRRRLIARLVVREFVAPFCVTLGLLTVGLGLRALQVYSELATTYGVSIGSLLSFELAPIVSRALPFASLLAVLVGVGRLVASRQVLALTAVGVAPVALLRPILAVAGAVTCLALLLDVSVIPWAARSLDRRMEVLSAERPLIALQPGMPLRAGEWRIDALSVGENGTEAHGAILQSEDQRTTLFARQAEFVRSDVTTVELVLHDAVTILDTRAGPRSVGFGSLRVPMASDGFVGPGSSERKLRGAATGALWSLAGKGTADVAAALELHSRFSRALMIPALCAVAFALAIRIGRVAHALNALVALCVLASAYGLVLVGDRLARTLWMSPTLGAWLPTGALVLVACASVVGLREGVAKPGREAAEQPFAGSRASMIGRRSGSSADWLLGRYVARRVLGILAFSLPAALFVQLVIDALGDMVVLSAHEPSAALLVHYYAFRLPMQAVNVLPIAIMVASAVALATMARDGEILGMATSGISNASVLAPIALAGLIAAAMQLVIAEHVVPRTNRISAETREAITHARTVSLFGPALSNFRRGGSFHVVAALDPERGRTGPITVFGIDDEGRPMDRLDADSAVRTGSEEWRLERASKAALDGGSPHSLDPPARIEMPGHALDLTDPRRLSASRLREEIRATEAAGFDSRWLRVELWSRLGAPLTVLLYPLLIGLIALRGPPHPPLWGVVAVAAGLAAAHGMGTGIALAFAKGGVIAPAAVALVPVFLILLALASISLHRRAGGEGGLCPGARLRGARGTARRGGEQAP